MSCRPATTADAYAIQDEIARALGPVGGWKVGMGGPMAEPTCAPVYRDRIVASGAALDPARYHGMALEIEFAFKLRRALPPRARPYTYDEIAQAVDFVPLIEVLGSRYGDRMAVTAAEQLADANANGAFIVGTPIVEWHTLDLRTLRVGLSVDGQTVQSACGTHPADDPLSLVVWLADHTAARCGGLKAGDIVTTGSLQGATSVAAGSRALGDWGSGGHVTLTIEG
ncbi:MAG: fumarylacetoacetate hydrolase family protein [Aliidongia sp.]